MDPEFEKAAFEASPNVVVGPIQSNFGFHLIKVADKKAAAKTPYEKAKLELAREAASELKAERTIAQLDEALKAQDSARVNKLVTESGFKWETTGPFDLNTQALPKVGNVDEFMHVAFELSPQKPLASHIVRFASKAFVIRHKDPGAPTIEKKDSKTKTENQPDLSEQLARGRMSEVLSSWEKALLTSSKVSRNSAVLDQ
jgi:LPS O-antigen subunit length determinant protein (WzzB/FepE family)